MVGTHSHVCRQCQATVRCFCTAPDDYKATCGRHLVEYEAPLEAEEVTRLLVRYSKNGEYEGE